MIESLPATVRGRCWAGTVGVNTGFTVGAVSEELVGAIFGQMLFNPAEILQKNASNPSCRMVSTVWTSSSRILNILDFGYLVNLHARVELLNLSI